MQNRQLEDKYMVRLPDGWRAEIKAIAAKNRRSMNQEILIALGSAFALEVEGEPEKAKAAG